MRLLIDKARLALVLSALMHGEHLTWRLAQLLGYADAASLRRVVRRSARMPLAAVRQRLSEEGHAFAHLLLTADDRGTASRTPRSM